MGKTQSVEPQIADLANGWLRSYKLDYKLEQEPTGNSEIDNALNEYFSKNGGTGGNRPDTKLLLKDADNEIYPILIEYKGYKDKLAKLDDKNQVVNKTSKNEPDFKNINSYALNGAVHYANAILHYTNFENIISIGMSGYKDDFGNLKHEIAVYLVSKSNFGVGQEVGKFSDFSFLKKENFNDFIDKVKDLSLSDEEKAQIKEKLDLEIATSLTKLNNDIYKNESGLGENDRVYLVTASIIATVGVKGKIKPLEKAELKSLNEDGNRDGDILMRKVKAFLKQKDIPEDKKALITRTLENTILSENLNKAIHGETQLKRVFSKIVDDLGIYYKTDLSTDFTGKLFNEMYSWLGFSQDKLNDVVLTPFFVATLLARLARVDKDSFVWDFATGSAGLLVAAMNEMIKDAKNEIKSPDELKHKIAHIKAKQLLGLEILPSVYMLAILNMILMGDGSSNILNKDSLNDFNGNYGFGENNKAEFPATAFILNPPYSAPGNGMIFVQKALEMMKKGYAAIIIQGSAGSGKASGYNKKILEQNTLIASIKMPLDLFIGKSSVQTYIYVFRVGEKHNKDEIVKFIDFSNDGYTRANRKKAKASLNLRDTGDAKARYDELVNLVRFGKSKLNIFTSKEYYEECIDPNNGSDWNKCAPIDTKPTLADFKKCVSEYLAWEVSQIIKNEKTQNQKDLLCSKRLESTKWQSFKIGELFDVVGTKSLDSNAVDFVENGINFVGRTFENNGIQGKIEKQKFEPNEPFTITATVVGNKYVKYQKEPYYCSQNINKLMPKPIFTKWSEKIAIFLMTNIWRFVSMYDGQYGGYKLDDIKNHKIYLPITANGAIDFEFMEDFVRELEVDRVRELEAYLKATGLSDCTLNDKEAQAIKLLQDSINGGGNSPQCSLKWQSFKIGELFEKIQQGARLKQADHIKGDLPFVMAGVVNTGIAGYISNDNARKFPPNALSIDIFGNVFYRGYKFGASDDVAVFWNEKGQFSKEVMLFLVAVIQKHLMGKFDFGYKLRASKSYDIVISLPVYNPAKDFKKDLPQDKGSKDVAEVAQMRNRGFQGGGEGSLLNINDRADNAESAIYRWETTQPQLAFDFMENFISAVQKECIKGVDNYLQTNINATKKVITK